MYCGLVLYTIFTTKNMVFSKMRISRLMSVEVVCMFYLHCCGMNNGVIIKVGCYADVAGTEPDTFDVTLDTEASLVSTSVHCHNL